MGETYLGRGKAPYLRMQGKYESSAANASHNSYMYEAKLITYLSLAS